MQGLEGLPPWLQVVLSIGMFVVTAWVYFSGVFKKLPPPPSKDVIVPSITLADNKVISDWVDTLRDHNRQDKEALELSRRALYLLEQINDRLESIEHKFCRRG